MFDISNCSSHRTISLFLSHSRYHLWTDAVNTFVCVVMFFHGHVAWLILQGSILSWNIARIHIFYLLAPSPISLTMVTERSRESNPCAKLPAFTTATAPAIRSVLLAETCNAASSSWIPNQQTDVGHERHREPTITTEGTDQSAQVQLLTTPLISSAAIYAGYCRSVPLELQHLWCLLSNEKKRNDPDNESYKDNTQKHGGTRSTRLWRGWRCQEKPLASIKLFAACRFLYFLQSILTVLWHHNDWWRMHLQRRWFDDMHIGRSQGSMSS